MIDYVIELTDNATTSAYALAATLTVGLLVIALLAFTASRNWKIVSTLLILVASVCFALALVFADPVIDAMIYYIKQFVS